MGWWMAIPAIISVASTIYKTVSATEQAGIQQQWQIYNANMGYNTALSNINSQLGLAAFNAAAARKAASAAASAQASVGAYNASIIRATALYNDKLFEEDLRLLWEKNDLDMLLIEKQRARERGGILAAQSASGTVMGVGSNREAIIAQKTQEELDKTIVTHNAEIQAAKIQNARAQSMWNAEVKARAVAWEGSVSAAVTMANANAQAASMLAQSAFSGRAQLQTAEYQRQAGIWGSAFDAASNRQSIWNNFMGGMFNSINSGIRSYYANRNPYGSLASELNAGSNYSMDNSLIWEGDYAENI